MRIALLAALLFSVAACGSKDGEGKAPASTAGKTTPAKTTPAKTTPAKKVEPKGLNFPGTMDGAKALLQGFLKPGADYAGMSKALRPTKGDYKALYNDAFAGKLDAMYSPAWDAGALVLKPKDGQTDLLLFSATTEDFKAGNEKAGKFPGGYKKIAGELKAGQTLYRFKFVKPGETLGMAFDGLAHVNGRWVIVPKPWRAMR